MKKYVSLIGCVLALCACAHNHEPSCDYYRSNLEAPIYFDFGTANIKAKSKQAIKEGIVFLQKHRFRHVQVDGYSDEIGGHTDYNMNLSRKRAEAVSKFLVDNGIAEKRISTAWHGAVSEKPYRKQRRVNITVK